MQVSISLPRPAALAGRSRSLLSAAGEFWCRLMHNEVTWPVHGRYRCQRCHREYPVPWTTKRTPRL